MPDISNETLDEVERALKVIRDTFCEGWCDLLSDNSVFTEEMEVDCSGCRSRAALARLRAEREVK